MGGEAKERERVQVAPVGKVLSSSCFRCRERSRNKDRLRTILGFEQSAEAHLSDNDGG